PAAEPRPHPGLPPQAGKGKSRPRLSLPRQRGRVGVGGPADSPAHSARCGSLPPPRPAHAGGAGGRAGRAPPPRPPTPRAGEGWGGGRRTPSTPLAAWTLRAHVTPVPHRGDEDGANATGASPCPTCP